MKRLIGILAGTTAVILLACCQPAQAATTVTVAAADFEGRIIGMDYSRDQIVILDTNGKKRHLAVTQDVINNFRVGDTVLVHPTESFPVLEAQENPKDFEGNVIRVDVSNNELVVLDTRGRERRVQLKQGMIGTYKVDDYVRIHLMADLKEAKTIETVNDLRVLEGNITSIDRSKGQIVVRQERGNDLIIWVRQGLITNYSMGQYVRIYTLPDHDEAQLVRVIR